MLEIDENVSEIRGCWKWAKSGSRSWRVVTTM